ncbi:restriction endonuclease subunit S [Gallionella capsiferriformans]|uniref:Restriction modification system DNA specificity domain n=1 Tax=Gallionella capsiferriformans (strain ES-2) TaxID=395494 RepID=D9SDG3_GALCS|nr:restriction endonuclease subunit S [Gallionella capsiferriformans]ADL56761.1 restriction modification system DNA specificity domain [Gallionella capsiferriformans ES-2]
MLELATLGAVVEKTTGTRNPTKAPNDSFIYVDVAAVDNTQKIIFGARNILGNAAPSRARKLIRTGDILVSTVRPNLNAVALVTADLDGQIASTGFCVLRATTKVLPEYLFYFVISRKFVDALSSLVAGALYPAVSDSQVLAQSLPLPSIVEQRRIVDILSRAGGIVKLRREAEKKSAELIPALFLDMFGDPATNPKGWPVVMLPDVLAYPFKNGLYLPKEKYAPEESGEGVEMVHMSDAFYGEVKRGGLRRVLAEEKQIRDYGLSKNDLLVARRSLTYDGAAKLCGIPASDEPLLFESSFIRLIPDSGKVRTEYLLYYLNDENTRRAHVLSRISGITISGINQAAMNQIPVMVPPLPKQGDFVERVSEVRSIQSQQAAATTTAQATFDALLAKVFAVKGNP